MCNSVCVCVCVCLCILGWVVMSPCSGEQVPTTGRINRFLRWTQCQRTQYNSTHPSSQTPAVFTELKICLRHKHKDPNLNVSESGGSNEQLPFLDPSSHTHMPQLICSNATVQLTTRPSDPFTLSESRSEPFGVFARQKERSGARRAQARGPA